MADSNAVEILKADLELIRKTKIEDGTVVKYMTRGGTVYVALFVGQYWYMSGGRRAGHAPLTHQKFLENVLGGGRACKVEVATAWETVQDSPAPSPTKGDLDFDDDDEDDD